MQVLTRKNPLKIEREKMALILYEKLTRLPQNKYCSHYKYQDGNLRTQNGFMQKIAPSREKHIPKTQPVKLLVLLCPLIYIGVHYKLDLQQKLNKRGTDQSVMGLATIEAIYTLYPEEEFLHIFKECSVIEKNGNVGAGNYGKLFSFYLCLGKHATHFDGEMETKNTALMRLFGTNMSFEKAVIFSDSSAAKQSIAKFDALPS
jgi:hypothetical protein